MYVVYSILCAVWPHASPSSSGCQGEQCSGLFEKEMAPQIKILKLLCSHVEYM